MQIYNTLTREKEIFKPLKHPEVKIYQCGPTVYNHAHIGNLKTSVIEDVVARILEFVGYKVHVTMNITDIDDKTIRDSQESGENLKDFTEKYTKIFFEDLEKLLCRKPNIVEPISNIIPEMVRMIQTMINRGFAYHAEDGSIYFDISKSENYGQLAQLDFQGMKSSVRVDNDEYDKEHASDFVLWKAWKQEDGENFWQESFVIPSSESSDQSGSSLSKGEEGKRVVIKGRPGWHIECSACAMKHCGKQIDIHMGGEDLIFPHHQNEIAQSEACTGKQFSKYWLHSGHLMVDGKKMSKSLGNFHTLRDIENRYFSDNPVQDESSKKRLYRALRMGFINGKYRDKIDFSFRKLEQNIASLKNIDETFQKMAFYRRESDGVRSEFRDYMQAVMQRFVSALENDFALPEAFAVLFEFSKYVGTELIQKSLSDSELDSCKEMYKSWNQVLGILDTSLFDIQQDMEIPEDIKELSRQRDEAKSQRNYVLADSIRDEIVQRGYIIKDTEQGAVIEKKR